MDMPGADIFSKLDRLVHEAQPMEIVKNLVLPRPKLFQEAAGYLRFGNFPVPRTSADKDALVNKILWKLGFRVPLYPSLNELFWRRLEALKRVTNLDLAAEADQEEARSVGVNLFVSLEEVLDQTLAFAVWSLLSDHYAGGRYTGFQFNLQTARIVMVGKLNGVDLGRGEHLVLNSSGKNNLFGLIEGLRAMADMADRFLTEEDPSLYQRPYSEFPGYAGESGVELFPFVHTVAILDLDREAALHITALLRDAARALVRGNVMSVRNRIQHGGRDFPSKDQLNTAISSIEQAVLALEAGGICPLASLYAGTAFDQYGRSCAELRDYRGRITMLCQPSELRSSGLPGSITPQAIFRTARLSASAEVLRFSFQEDSEFSRLWADYPRRSSNAKIAGDASAERAGIEESTPEAVPEG